jgi:hypothetical protein
MRGQARRSTGASRAEREAAPTHGGAAGERVHRGQSGTDMPDQAKGNIGASSLGPGEEQCRHIEARGGAVGERVGSPGAVGERVGRSKRRSNQHVKPERRATIASEQDQASRRGRVAPAELNRAAHAE